VIWLVPLLLFFFSLSLVLDQASTLPVILTLLSNTHLIYFSLPTNDVRFDDEASSADDLSTVADNGAVHRVIMSEFLSTTLCYVKSTSDYFLVSGEN
jgi:hypothetical protein